MVPTKRRFFAVFFHFFFVYSFSKFPLFSIFKKNFTKINYCSIFFQIIPVGNPQGQLQIFTQEFLFKKWNEAFNDDLEALIRSFLENSSSTQPNEFNSYEDADFKEFLGRQKKIQKFLDNLDLDIRSFAKACSKAKTTTKAQSLHGIGQGPGAGKTRFFSNLVMKK